jgi:hypothetical protein
MESCNEGTGTEKKAGGKNRQDQGKEDIDGNFG